MPRSEGQLDGRNFSTQERHYEKHNTSEPRIHLQ
jgi:hypothetical protein